jgi:hypothetical protein
VDADVLDGVEPDETAGIGSRTPADAGDEAVCTRQTFDLGAGLIGHGRVFGSLDDRRERPVDIEQNGRLLRLAPQPNELDGRAHDAS